jgi:hypothetical protein
MPKSINSPKDGASFDKWIYKYEFLEDFPVSDKTLNNNCESGEIPNVYLGGIRIINRTKLEQMPLAKLNNGHTPAATAIA